MNNIVLFTCTVKPQTDENVKITSPRERVKEYVKAIDFFSRELKSTSRLVVLENSGFVDELSKALVNRGNIEFLQTDLDLNSATEGKSAGELGMLRYFCSTNPDITTEKIWKVTGHLQIKNINRILSDHINCDAISYIFSGSSSCDSRLFGMNQSLFHNFATNKVSFSEKKRDFKLSEMKFKSMEQYLFFFLANASQNNLYICQPDEPPVFIGKSFSTGKKLVKGKVKISARHRAFLRQFARRIASGYELGG